MKSQTTITMKKFGNEEFQHYLSKYQNIEPHKFAIIKISGECIQNNLEELVDNLGELQQLGLTPIIIFGWGNILNQKLESQGIKPEFKNGNRITDKTTFDSLTTLIEEITSSFINMGIKYGVKFKDLSNEKIFSAKKISDELGYVENITDVTIDSIINSCNNQTIPIIAPIGYDEDHKYNINADTAGIKLAEAVLPLKYIAVTKTGGILDHQGKIIKKISIIDDYQYLVESETLTGGMLKKVDEAKQLLEKIKNGYSVQVVSPDDILKELMTYKGAGSKIVLGYKLSTHFDINNLDKEKLTFLIENSFKKKLVTTYFKTEKIKKIILEEDYDGAAIIQNFNGWEYMDKFVVGEKAQGTGLGFKLLTEWIKSSKHNQEKGIFWRAKKTNSYNNNYFKNIVENDGGSYAKGEWIIYWIGGDVKQLPELIQYAFTKKKTIID